MEPPPNTPLHSWISWTDKPMQCQDLHWPSIVTLGCYYLQILIDFKVSDDYLQVPPIPSVPYLYSQVLHSLHLSSASFEPIYCFLPTYLLPGSAPSYLRRWLRWLDWLRLMFSYEPNPIRCLIISVLLSLEHFPSSPFLLSTYIACFLVVFPCSRFARYHSCLIPTHSLLHED